jgi:hypothetical protein
VSVTVMFEAGRIDLLAAAFAGNGFSEPDGTARQYPSLAGELLRLRACVQSRMDVCRIAVPRLTGNRNQPALVFDWR